MSASGFRVGQPMPRTNLVVSVTSPTDFANRVRVVAAAVDPTLRIEAVQPLGNLDNPIRSLVRMAALVIGLTVLTVLGLATAGIYALTSFNVTQRRREIGVRSALGAQPGRVLASVFARIGMQLGIGVFIGLFGAVAVERTLVSAITFGPPLGVSAFIAVTLLMVAVGVLAAWGPARRGLRIGPMEALRSD
jgi:ABC-type antimicrobial peptide transport system permease subunit